MNTTERIPLVSVVMCTYNAQDYLAEAIKSVLSQSFCDFEFIIWDDGSTDKTREIVSSFYDKRIRYYYHENTGLGMALRLACAEAKGKYIARMDSDDICLPKRFQFEVNFLESHEDFVLVSSAVYNIDEEGNVLGRVFPCSDDIVLKRILLVPGSMISHPMSMMRRDAYEKAGGYIPIRKSQDMLFWSRLANYGKFYNISEPLGKYRLLSSSLEHSYNPYKVVLMALLGKMIKDSEVLDSDVERFNDLYHYSKGFISDGKERSIGYKKSFEERAFAVVRFFLGSRLAERVIVKTKNVYYRVKLWA